MCTVSDQHVGKETVSATERLYVKLIPDQSVDAETSQVDDRIHLRMSSLASATTESQEVPEHAVVKLVDGRHVSHETAEENAVKPSIRLHAERHATMETDPSLLVCLVSVYTFSDCLCHNQVELSIDLRFSTVILSSGAAVGRWQSFDMPFSLPPALRPRHGPVRNSRLTLGLVLYVYRA